MSIINNATNTKTSKKAVYYLGNWATYGRNYQIKNIPINYISEIVYSFFNVSEKGLVFSSDPYSDFEKRFTDPKTSVIPADSWTGPQEPFYGNLGQLAKLKRQGKKFDLTLSIGGWGFSKNFSKAVAPENRKLFVSSLIDIFNKYPIFSGVSLDWEYFTNDGINHGNSGNNSSPQDPDNFIELIKLLKTSLIASGKSNYNISVCCSGDPMMIKPSKIVDISKLESISYIHIMTYDYSGFGAGTTMHHTNIKSCTYSAFSIQNTINAFLKAGVSPGKMMIGSAAYSRGFSGSSGPGTIGTGISSDISWEAGVVDYRDLPKKGAKEYWDPDCEGTFSFDPVKKIYNSYDNEYSAYMKSKYIWNNSLAGIIVWEISGDLPVNNARSLAKAYYKYLISGVDPRLIIAPPCPEVWKASIFANSEIDSKDFIQKLFQ